MSVDELEAEARKLPEDEQIALAERLLGVADAIPADVEQAHLSEVQRRIKEYREGKVQGKDIKEILARTEERIRGAEAAPVV